MPTTEFLRYTSKGIAELLDEENLAVPMYQRSYSWRSKESKDAGDDGADGRAQVVEYW